MRRFLAPEVVQTSALDCGPAALKCLLEGYRIPVAYGRLREACQTGLDGTSIDTLEVVANQLGLIAGQVLLPVDHLLLREAKAFPCLLVTTLPNGVTHFVVLWRKHGSLLQVMDPAVGRRWVSTKEFLREVYAHTMPAEADEWRHFAASEDSRKMFAERMRKVGLRSKRQLTLVTNALHDEGWRSLAILDAAIRLVAALRDSGAIRSADDSARLLERMIANPECIPERYWSVRSAPQDSAGAEQVLVQGAVLIRILGSQPPASGEELGTELSAALSARAASPGRELFNVFWHSGRLAIALILCGLVVSAAATLGEGLLFRGLLDISTELGLAGQRMGAMSALAFFCVALLFLELPVFLYSVRIGRYIENRLRLKFLEKIPRLSDRYFQSRLISDMAERSHVAHRLRDLAGHVHQLLRAVLEFTFTAAGIVWLEPSYSHHMMAIAAVALAPPFLLQSLLTERDLRVRTHAAGLTRFYLDAMLGLVAVRAHGAENAVRRDHERFLGEWANASVRLQRTAAALEAAQLTALFGLIGGLFLWHPLEGADIGRTLLIAYWALNLPALGQEIGTLLRQYPAYRNLTLRLMEPLSAPEETPACEIPFGPGECAAPSLTFDA
ncbi:MAG: hypothetical protein JO270_11765, partial [Acidobacteriaceae bacterium]|nr:hypothetical protein [Acidobacteriaceae bacterium]